MLAVAPPRLRFAPCLRPGKGLTRARFNSDRLLVDAFEAARSRQLASGDLSDIGAAVVAGRVATLLIDADRVVPGRFDADTGAVRFGAMAEPGTDDLLDDLAEAVLRQGGEVVVVPSARMPVQSGAAATYRY